VNLTKFKKIKKSLVSCILGSSLLLGVGGANKSARAYFKNIDFICVARDLFETTYRRDFSFKNWHAYYYVLMCIEQCYISLCANVGRKVALNEIQKIISILDGKVKVYDKQILVALTKSENLPSDPKKSQYVSLLKFLEYALSDKILQDRADYMMCTGYLLDSLFNNGLYVYTANQFLIDLYEHIIESCEFAPETLMPFHWTDITYRKNYVFIQFPAKPTMPVERNVKYYTRIGDKKNGLPALVKTEKEVVSAPIPNRFFYTFVYELFESFWGKTDKMGVNENEIAKNWKTRRATQKLPMQWYFTDKSILDYIIQPDYHDCEYVLPAKLVWLDNSQK